jgi:hypothetical protein
MPRRPILRALCLILLIIPPLHAQTITPHDAFAALYTAVDSYLDKAHAHQLFTYTFFKQLTYSKASGKPYAHRTQKFEMLYIGGRPYVRLLESDGKPLSGKAAQNEQQRYDQAVQDSSGMSMAKWIDLHAHGHAVGYDLPLDDLKSKFSTQFLGSETIDGLPLLHFHLHTISNSMDEPHPVTPQEIDLWLDYTTKSLVKMTFHLLADSPELLTGSSGTTDYFLVDGILCTGHANVHYIFKTHNHVELVDSDLLYANYKKFTTTIKILPDPEPATP